MARFFFSEFFLEGCQVPTVTPSGGHRGQDRRPSWLQHCDTQQMMQVAEGIGLPEVSSERFALKDSVAAMIREIAAS